MQALRQALQKPTLAQRTPATPLQEMKVGFAEEVHACEMQALREGVPFGELASCACQQTAREGVRAKPQKRQGPPRPAEEDAPPSQREGLSTQRHQRRLEARFAKAQHSSDGEASSA